MGFFFLMQWWMGCEGAGGGGEEVGWAGTRVCVCGHVNLAAT